MNLSGIYVPMVTPFDDAGAVDAEALRTLAESILSEGATGLVALGTTGEPATLTPAERATVVEV
jgi:4-hydroxy-tetrahydrodipicolinate synthase